MGKPQGAGLPAKNNYWHPHLHTERLDTGWMAMVANRPNDLAMSNNFAIDALLT
jgi:hypothetical protein